MILVDLKFGCMILVQNSTDLYFDLSFHNHMSLIKKQDMLSNNYDHLLIVPKKKMFVYLFMTEVWQLGFRKNVGNFETIMLFA